MDDAHRHRHTPGPARESARAQRSSRSQSQGPVKPFAWGFALGCLASGILAVAITGSPVPFVSGGADKPAADTKTGPQANTPAPKISSGAPAPSASASGALPSVAANAPSTTHNAAPSASNASAAANADSDRAKPTGFFVQTGAFKSRGDAERQQAQLALAGFESSLVSLANDNIVRVRLGPYTSAAKANQVRDQLSESGVQSTLVKP